MNVRRSTFRCQIIDMDGWRCGCIGALDARRGGVLGRNSQAEAVKSENECRCSRILSVENGMKVYLECPPAALGTADE
jgi:hypothetical protein